MKKFKKVQITESLIAVVDKDFKKKLGDKYIGKGLAGPNIFSWIGEDSETPIGDGIVVATIGEKIKDLPLIEFVTEAEFHVFETTITKSQRKVWKYWYQDAEMNNQHSGAFDTKQLAIDAYTLAFYSRDWTDKDMREMFDISREKINHPDWDYIYDDEDAALTFLKNKRLNSEEIEFDESILESEETITIVI